MKLSTLKDWAKAQAARTIWAYGPDELVTRLRAVAEERQSDKIYLRADGAIPYARVMEVMGALNAAGVNNIVLVTEAGGPRMDADG